MCGGHRDIPCPGPVCNDQDGVRLGVNSNGLCVPCGSDGRARCLSAPLPARAIALACLRSCLAASVRPCQPVQLPCCTHPQCIALSLSAVLTAPLCALAMSLMPAVHARFCLLCRGSDGRVVERLCIDADGRTLVQCFSVFPTHTFTLLHAASWL